jgi:hypothetical protein
MRHFLLIAAVGLLLSSGGQVTAAVQDEIIPEALANRCGLTRMWVSQAQVNRGQGKLQAVLFCDGQVYRKAEKGTDQDKKADQAADQAKKPEKAAEEDRSDHRFVLFAQSNRATLEAIDAETGQMLWSKMIGQPSHPSLPPGACGDLVATINGCTLYVMNRYTGDILFQTTVDGAPGGGPALSTVRAYVPMVNGMLLAYRLEPVTDAAKELGKIDPHAADMTDDEKKEAKKKAEEERRQNIRIRQEYVPPLACSSTGRTLVQPLVTTQNSIEELLAWVTDRGYLYVGRVDRRSKDALEAKHRLGSQGTFSSPPAYLPPNPKVLGDSGVVYAGSSDGNVYAMQERGGEMLWKFPASDPVIDSPVVIENRIYATTELGGMFCLSADKGKQIWWAPDVLHFVAAGKNRVYASDKVGRLRILDARSGAMLDSLPTSAMPIKISNGLTDRIYLATEGGVIQCLREVEQPIPVVMNEARKPFVEEEQPKAAPKTKPKSADGDAPKVAHDRPAPKKPVAKPAVKKGKKDADVGDADADADKPAKPAKKAAAKAKAAKGKKGADADADAGGGGDNPFGGK